MKIWILLFLVAVAFGLRCYEGTVKLDSNLRTDQKDCGVSSYCVQKINRGTGEIRRECASWSDEHSMEEKCPMSGCHWQSNKETYCCCQFDLCNEYKADGTQFHEKEMRLPGQEEAKSVAPQPPKPPKQEKPTAAPVKVNVGWNVPVTTAKPRTDEIQLD